MKNTLFCIIFTKNLVNSRKCITFAASKVHKDSIFLLNNQIKSTKMKTFFSWAIGILAALLILSEFDNLALMLIVKGASLAILAVLLGVFKTAENK